MRRFISSRLGLVLRGASVTTLVLVVGAISCSSGGDDGLDGALCVAGGSGQSQHAHLSTRVGRASMDVDVSASNGVGSEHLVLKVDDALYLDATTERKDGGAFVSDIKLGRFFHGMSSVHFTSADGVEIAGDIDGRQLAPFHKGQDPTLRDGSALNVTLDEDAKRAVAQLSTQSSGGMGQCTALADPGQGSMGSGYSNPGHASFPELSGGCIGCNLACASAAGGCALGVALGCAAIVFPPAYVVCLVVGGLACLGVYVGCTFACFQTGALCCPVGCGNGCCSNGETCLNTGTQLCCGAGTKTCVATNGSGDENCLS